MLLLICDSVVSHAVTYTTRMTIPDYSAKPVRGDGAIIMGSLEIAQNQLLNCTVVTSLGLVKVQ